MRALMLEPDPAWLAERSRLGHDTRDEVWDGVLHVVPQPAYWHQQFLTDLIVVLAELAKRRGFRIVVEPGVYDPVKGATNYRVPDLVIVDPSHTTKRGIEGRIELAVEILSPNDESRDKLAFYAAQPVHELWLIDPHTRELEIYVLRNRTYFAVLSDAAGITNAPCLGLALQVVDGPKLRIAWADGSAEL